MDICKECGQSHDEIREKLRKSLFLTAKILCKFQDFTVDFHGRLAGWVEDNLRGGNRRLMVLASRGFFKSSLLTIAGAIWFIINDPEVRILIVQASADKVRDVMNALMGVLKSDMFMHYFPELVPRESEDKFSERAITVPRRGVYPEATISARGVNSTVTGGHFDIQILDDVIDETMADSAIEMARAERFFRNSPPLFVRPKTGIQIVVGTRWALNDVYGFIKDRGTHVVWETGWKADERSDKMGFTIPHGEPLFPERFGHSDAKLTLSISDPVTFSFQYENVPMVEGLQRFTHGMLKWFNWVDYGKRFVADEREYATSELLVRITVDPSLGETAESDEFALAVVGWHRLTARAFVLDLYHGRINPIQQVKKIFAMVSKWRQLTGKIPVVGIEKAGYQSALKTFVEEFQRQNKDWFPVELISHMGVRKSRRIEALQPYFANGQVFLRRDQAALIQQLVGFQPKADGSTGLRHDDCLDALAYHVRWWRGVTADKRNAPLDELDDLSIDDEWGDDPEKEPHRKSLYGLVCET